MTQRTTIELWFTVDSEGQYEVSTDREEAVDRHTDNNGVAGSLAIHCLTLSVPLPQDQLAAITLPDDKQEEPVVVVD